MGYSLSNVIDGKHLVLDAEEGTDSTLEFAEAVASGLEGDTKTIPCRYLYDARGSALFEEICKQPEYYPTRTEAKILRDRASEIAALTGPLRIAELGSGTSVKTRHILEAYLEHAEAPHYIPVDVSAAAMREATRTIQNELPDVTVSGIIGRYENAFSLFPELSPLMVIFLGSTIGNFGEADMHPFLKRLADHLRGKDFFLLGADLEKDREILEAAYNDASGVTAAFTLNLFERMNCELDAGIDLDTVEHVAHYNQDKSRIEIHARFQEEQEIYLAPLDEIVKIEAGEKVRTEISRKFRVDELKELLERCGFRLRRVFTDEREWFALFLVEREKRDG
jgi:L-histidine N-alpha-methyltransferase